MINTYVITKDALFGFTGDIEGDTHGYPEYHQKLADAWKETPDKIREYKNRIDLEKVYTTAMLVGQEAILDIDDGLIYKVRKIGDEYKMVLIGYKPLFHSDVLFSFCEEVDIKAIQDLPLKKYKENICMPFCVNLVEVLDDLDIKVSANKFTMHGVSIYIVLSAITAFTLMHYFTNNTI